MKLSSLAINRMPGFKQQGFIYKEDQLSSGLNIILGPNGSGKTTSCIAIRGILWPSTLKGISPVALQSCWQLGDQKINVELEGNFRSIYPQNAQKLIDALPSDRHARCYTVTVDDLFSSADLDFATEIAREASGGYDLNNLMQELHLDLPSYHGRTEKRKLDDARQNLRKILIDQKKLSNKESSLEELKLKIEEAKQAKNDFSVIEESLKFKKVKKSIEELEAYLNTFPNGLDYLRGDELNTLKDFFQKEKTIHFEINELNSKLAQVNEKQKAIPFVLDILELNDLLAKANEFKDIELEKYAIEKEINQVNFKLKELCNFLKVDETYLDHLCIDEMTKVRSHWLKQQELILEKNEIELRMQLLSHDSWDEAKMPQVRQSLNDLNHWVHLDQQSKARSSTWLILSLVCSFYGIIILFFLPKGLALFGLMAAFLGNILCTFISYKKSNQFYLEKKDIEKKFHQNLIYSPKVWSKDIIQKSILELENLLSKMIRSHSDRLIFEDLTKRKLILDEKQKQFKQDLISFSKNNGYVGDEIENFSLFLETFKEARSLYIQSLELKNELKEKSEIYFSLYNYIYLKLGNSLTQREISSKDLLVIVNQLIENEQNREKLTDSLKYLNRELEKTQIRFNDLIEEKNQFLIKCQCFTVDPENELSNKIKFLEDYQKTTKELHKKQAELSVIQNHLKHNKNYLPNTENELIDVLNQKKILASNYEALIENNASIKKEIDIARQSCPLELAQDEVFQKEKEFQIAFTQLCENTVGQFLISSIEDQYRKESQPKIFSKADYWLSRFSHGEYSLKIPEQSGEKFTFLAHDCRINETKSLDALSRGTRMQLLLAVRLAFSALHEDPSNPMPFFFDEILNSTDPERFRTIAEALLEMADSGRQLFYFTCQPSDAEVWKHIAHEKKKGKVQVIDLAKVKNQNANENYPLIIYTKNQIPSPKEQSIEQYAIELNIPGINVNLSVDEVPSYYLLKSPETLYQCHLLNLLTYGQLKNIYRFDDVPLILKNEKSTIIIKGQILERFFSLYQMGRGKKLSREIVEKIGISEKYFNVVIQLARDFDYDAKRLMAAIDLRQDERLKGFHKKIAEQIKTYMLNEGYLDERPILNKDEMNLHLLQMPILQNNQDSEILIFINRLLELIC